VWKWQHTSESFADLTCSACRSNSLDSIHHGNRTSCFQHRPRHRDKRVRRGLDIIRSPEVHDASPPATASRGQPTCDFCDSPKASLLDRKEDDSTSSHDWTVKKFCRLFLTAQISALLDTTPLQTSHSVQECSGFSIKASLVISCWRNCRCDDQRRGACRVRVGYM
jgi:hypothetical protein